MCNKSGYVTEAEAKADAINLRSGQRFSKQFDCKKKMHPYKCPHCEFWHLTSMSKNTERTYKRMQKRAK